MRRVTKSCWYWPGNELCFPKKVQTYKSSCPGSCIQKVYNGEYYTDIIIKQAMVFLLTTMVMQEVQQHGSSNICQSMQTPKPAVSLDSRAIDIIQ